jgi:Zn-dependent peptidase ImmA (M78 family)
MHDDTVNRFDITRANLATNAEYEANLFAVALLFDDKDFNIPLEQMSGSVLKSIMDFNIF